MISLLEVFTIKESSAGSMDELGIPRKLQVKFNKLDPENAYLIALLFLNDVGLSKHIDNNKRLSVPDLEAHTNDYAKEIDSFAKAWIKVISAIRDGQANAKDIENKFWKDPYDSSLLPDLKNQNFTSSQNKDDGIIKSSGSVTKEIGLQLLTKYRDKIKEQKGIDIPENPRVLGEGTKGVAFDIGGKAIKVTADYKEAKTSAVIQGNPQDFVAKIFDVFKFGKFDYYGIVQELLKKLSASEIDKINGAIIMSGFRDKMRYNKNLSTDAIVSQIESGNHMKKQAMEYLKKLGVVDMSKALEGMGIRFWDFHGDNLMKRGNQLVLIDLGYSEVGGTQNIPTVESKKIQLANLFKF